jgi:glycosyltransferase involved in cell wall biosynthesis
VKNNKKSILFITPFQPLNNSGDSFITWGIIKGLSKINSSVEVISFKENKKTKLKTKIKNTSYFSKPWKYPSFSLFKKLLLFFSISPFFVNKFFDHEFLEKIKNKTKNKDFDQIIIYGYAMAKYGSFLNHKKMIYLEDEDMGKIFKARFISEKRAIPKIFLLTEYVKSLFYQRLYFRKFKKFWILNNKNKNSYFSKNSKKIKIPLLVQSEKICFSNKSKDIVFTGTLNWDENKQGLIWFLKDIWPDVLKKNKKSIFHIVGKNNDSDIKRVVEESENVISHGFVDDLEDVYKKSALAVSPIWVNAGIKIKILNYLQYGLPVVASKISTEALFSLDGIVVARKEYFAKKINSLLVDNKKRRLIARKAHENIKKNYSIKNLASFLNQELW